MQNEELNADLWLPETVKMVKMSYFSHSEKVYRWHGDDLGYSVVQHDIVPRCVCVCVCMCEYVCPFSSCKSLSLTSLETIMTEGV